MADREVTADPASGRIRPPRPAAGPGPRQAARSGWLFSAPYLIFVLVIFAYPLIFAGYMSFHDYFFAAPGAVVDRPFVGIENYTDALTDPAVRQSFVNVGIFLIINVPLTVVLSLVLATLLNRVGPAADLPAGQLLRAVRDGERRRRRRLAVPVQR